METIAIIDDDIYIGDMLEKVLKKEGYATLRAYSGTEALMLFERSRPGLILLDLMLPGLSGEELLEKIHDIPVIVISAKVDVSDKVNVLLQGACDYLTKPFDIQELLARITVQFRNQKHKENQQLFRH
ncbi:MAG: response regulator transcription factor, partial [Eubacterium sp.]|nr:response regulator transcription factor [Eubacterium sp.]